VRGRKINSPITDGTGTRRSRYWTMDGDRLSALQTRQLEERSTGLADLCVEIATKMDQFEEAGAPNWMLKKVGAQLEHNLKELDKVNAILEGRA